jgi:proline utilization trans-activator
MFDDRPWFHNHPGAPILIGEAADAAFATRFCQALSTEPFNHIQRKTYPSDNTLLSLGGAICPLPSPGRARFLLKAATKFVSERYHIVLKSAVFSGLERFLQQPAEFDIVQSSKIWALLALGEAFTTRSSSSGEEMNFPGLAYFAQANRARQFAQERPSLDSIEVHLLLVRLLCNVLSVVRLLADPHLCTVLVQPDLQ